jgi:hypothetical protein
VPIYDPWKSSVIMGSYPPDTSVGTWTEKSPDVSTRIIMTNAARAYEEMLEV